MPRVAKPKKATTAKVQKRKVPAAKKKAAAPSPRKRVTFKPASGETLKENATQLEVAERMLAELASRDQAETDPAVAAQRALRSAILTGAISPSSIVLKPAAAMTRRTPEDIKAEAMAAAAKSAADATAATAKAASKAASKIAKAAATAEILRRLAEISASTSLSAIGPAETEAAKAGEKAEREKKAKERLKRLKEKAVEEEAKRKEAEDVLAKMTEMKRREKARDDAAAEASRKLDELKALEGDKIKLAVSKAEAERVQKEHNAETTRMIAAIKASKSGDPTDIIYDATTGLPVNGYKRIGPKKNTPAVALKTKLKKVEIVKRENKYYVNGEPSAAILNLNRAMPTEMTPDYDPAEEERLDRELERAAEEARILKEIADRAEAESKVIPADYPKPKPGPSAPTDRPPKPSFLDSIGSESAKKLTPFKDRILPTITPKKPTHEDVLAAAIAKALAARRGDIKPLTDEEIAAKEKEDEDWEDPPILLGTGRKSKSEIQAVGFPQDEWTPAQARRWLKEHGAVPIKPMRREGSWLRWRITPPGYRSYTTKTLRSNGKAVHLILGH